MKNAVVGTIDKHFQVQTDASNQYIVATLNQEGAQ